MLSDIFEKYDEADSFYRKAVVLIQNMQII